MAKEKRIEAELQLPEAIIQHIQSFLMGCRAAQTTILSKSWYNAWLTRPNLDFGQGFFLGRNYTDPDHEDVSSFWGFVNKTLQRYEKLNLKIGSLRLGFGVYGKVFSYDEETIAKEVIIKAIKMGAIDLCIQYVMKNDTLFALPHEVFEFENLIRLYLGGCEIGLRSDGNVRCSRLKYLRLFGVKFKGDIFWDIISSCPLIEDLSLSRCSVNKQFSIAYTSTRMLSLGPFGKRNVGSAVEGSVNMYQFHKLRRLFLNQVNIHTSFFGDFSSKFPCLKDLTLDDCDGFKGIRISGPSLECIKFIRLHKMQTLTAKFDVPRIRRFTFSGIDIPSLSFKTGTRNWESSISITCLSNKSDRWFLNLNKLLTKLSLSKVSLKLKVCSLSFARAGNFQGLPKPVVENLTIHNPSSVCPAFFGIIVRCCRPVYVAQSLVDQFSFDELRNNSVEDVAYKRLMQQASLICSSINQSACGPCDLGEVYWEFFDVAVSAWRPLLPDSLTRQLAERRIRVHLRWGQEPAAVCE